MNYICELCNYKTSDHSNYLRHKKTKKHLEKSKMIPKTTIKKLSKSPGSSRESLKLTVDKETNIYECKYCKNYFSKPGNLSRHYKICVEKKHFENIENIQTENKIKILEQKIEAIQKEKESIIKQSKEKIKFIEKEKDIIKRQSEEKLKIIEKESKEKLKILEKENEYHKQLVISAGNMIQSSMSTLNHLITYYNNAPILEPIKDYSLLEEKNKFINNLIYYHKENKLDQYLGNFLVKQYKTKDPKERSNWNSDTSRLTYINRELVNNQPNWVIDKKGIKMTNIIIDPLLNYIKRLLQEDIVILKNEMEHNSENREDLLSKMIMLNEIIKNINNKVLSKEINRFLAPHLYFDKNNFIIVEK